MTWSRHDDNLMAQAQSTVDEINRCRRLAGGELMTVKSRRFDQGQFMAEVLAGTTDDRSKAVADIMALAREAEERGFVGYALGLQDGARIAYEGGGLS